MLLQCLWDSFSVYTVILVKCSMALSEHERSCLNELTLWYLNGSCRLHTDSAQTIDSTHFKSLLLQPNEIHLKIIYRTSESSRSAWFLSCVHFGAWIEFSKVNWDLNPWCGPWDCAAVMLAACQNSAVGRRVSELCWNELRVWREKTLSSIWTRVSRLCGWLMSVWMHYRHPIMKI